MKILTKLLALLVMLPGLPMLGIVLAGYPAARYLEFPPSSRYVGHAPFSWPAFFACALLILAVVAPLIARIIASLHPRAGRTAPSRRFPWWGWLGVLTGAAAWILAWTRFSWYCQLQPHTFTPLWLSYILVIHALTYRRSGRCMLLHETRRFVLLFPLSAGFWWFFEVLNRFVQNWRYVGGEFGPLQYFLYATLSFSTVLPAVLGTRDWINTFSWVRDGFAAYHAVRPGRPRRLAWAGLLLSAAGLGGIGVWPNVLYPLLWISPLVILVSIQSLLGEDHVLSGIAAGNWQGVVSAALAALMCGFFWEMWNSRSMVRWEYAVPLVHRFELFEMPLLGYAGYIPFGLECVAAADLLGMPRATGASRPDGS